MVASMKSWKIFIISYSKLDFRVKKIIFEVYLFGINWYMTNTVSPQKLAIPPKILPSKVPLFMQIIILNRVLLPPPPKKKEVMVPGVANFFTECV